MDENKEYMETAEVSAEDVSADAPEKVKTEKDHGEGIKKYRYAGSRKFNIGRFDTTDKGEFDGREEAVDEFVDNLHRINKLQQKLYAERKEGVIFIFQAMDAAGKDGVIRTVFSTLTPHGVKEFCFKVPSSEELSHDYLWRFWSALPPKGNISIFNRSYYEDVLVGKVRKLYENQACPDRLKGTDVIRQRYAQIKDFEKYLYNTGTRVVKIFLNVSKDEQARRFISRIDTPKKNWKVSAGDISERALWDEYMDAFEKMVNTTSSENSPWYVVPADHKWYARLIVSRIVLKTLEDMDPQYPTIGEDELNEAMVLRQALADSITDGADIENEPESEFTNTEDIAADILFDEVQSKISEKKKKIKNNGFRAVREMLARGYILKSKGDIIEAVAAAGDNDVPDEEPELPEPDMPDTEAAADAGNEMPGIESVITAFGIAPVAKVSAKEKAVLLCIAEEGEKADFYSMCDKLDMRPSKLKKHIGSLAGLDLAEMDENGAFSLTDEGERLLNRTESSDKSEKKFVKFLECLNGDELADFIALCSAFESEQPAEENEQSAEAADAPADAAPDEAVSEDPAE